MRKVVDCEGEAFRNDALRHYEAYTGIPAPAYLEDDSWFGPAPVRTKKQMDCVAQEAEIKMVEEQERSEKNL